MKKSIYFNNCLREIRQTVYGRDMRKPVADAIEEVKNSSTGIIVKHLIDVETESTQDVDSFRLILMVSGE